MEEKRETTVADDKSEARNSRRMTNSTTEADSDGHSSHRLSHYEKDEAAGPEGHARSDDEIERPLEDVDADIDHDEVEATVPGHDLDVELGRVCLRPPLLLSTSPPLSLLGIDPSSWVRAPSRRGASTTSQATFSTGVFPELHGIIVMG